MTTAGFVDWAVFDRTGRELEVVQCRSRDGGLGNRLLRRKIPQVGTRIAYRVHVMIS
jgi:hypothetical protein